MIGRVVITGRNNNLFLVRLEDGYSIIRLPGFYADIGDSLDISPDSDGEYKIDNLSNNIQNINAVIIGTFKDIESALRLM